MNLREIGSLIQTHVEGQLLVNQSFIFVSSSEVFEQHLDTTCRFKCRLLNTDKTLCANELLLWFELIKVCCPAMLYVHLTQASLLWGPYCSSTCLCVYK